MTRLDVARCSSATDIVLRSHPNWPAVWFLAALGTVHLLNASHAFVHGRWEGFLSLIFGGVFVSAALVCRLVKTEIAVLSGTREVRLRTGYRRFHFQRFISAQSIRSIRLTLLHTPETSRVEIVCIGEVIECPPTSIPRQEALCLAMSLGVRLIKVYSEAFGPAAERIEALPPPR